MLFKWLLAFAVDEVLVVMVVRESVRERERERERERLCYAKSQCGILNFV